MLSVKNLDEHMGVNGGEVGGKTIFLKNFYINIL